MQDKPTITAPVMRLIGVADAERSTQFYREVLGFEMRERDGAMEAMYGPARLQFRKQDYAPCDQQGTQASIHGLPSSRLNVFVMVRNAERLVVFNSH